MGNIPAKCPTCGADEYRHFSTCPDAPRDPPCWCGSLDAGYFGHEDYECIRFLRERIEALEARQIQLEARQAIDRILRR